MSKPATSRTREVRCTAPQCKRLGSREVRKWGRWYGPYCDTHADETQREMDAFDERLDRKKAEIAERLAAERQEAES